MREFVFANYVLLIKESWCEEINNEDLVNLLLGLIIHTCDVKDKNGEVFYLEKAVVSKVLNRKVNVTPKVTRYAGNENVVHAASDYFEKHIVRKLASGSENQLVQNICMVIDKASNMDDAAKKKFISLAEEATVADFLAAVFLETLKKENKDKGDKIKKSQAKYLTITEHEEIDPEEYKKHPLKPMEPPENVEVVERPFTSALLQIYGQKEGNVFSMEMLEQFPLYQNHFSRQRRYYYAAEAVRRGTRDIYSSKGENQFEVLKNEVYDGIIDTWEMSYKNGMMRLQSVLKQAAVVAIQKCWLSRETDWVGNAEKNGVCHFLVNDNKLSGWVRDDDEDEDNL